MIYMFPNLEAEQKRYGLTNADVAKILQVSRTTYEAKKKNGNFSRSQLVILCNYFHCNFEYLFMPCERQQGQARKPPADRPA